MAVAPMRQRHPHARASLQQVPDRRRGTIGEPVPWYRDRSKVSSQYDPSKIEPAIAERWLANNTYSIGESERLAAYYALTMFPYPSGDGTVRIMV